MALNAIAECGGEELISDLVKSEKKYNYIKTTDANSYADPLGDGSVEIGISSSSIGNHDSFYSAVAHESMHGAQYEHGQGGRSIFNEVEAYVFEYVISQNTLCGNSKIIFSSGANSYNDNFLGNLFSHSINSLAYNGFDVSTLASAIISFKKGSALNNNGIYNSDPFFLNTTKQSLLQYYNIKVK